MMSNNKLQILGLGRCIIGHMAKYVNEHTELMVDFQHHYLLNYETIIHSNVTCKDMENFSKIVSMPRLYDQWCCLDNVEKYDVCAIEIFPSAPLYTSNFNKLFACFESYTEQLKDVGFKPYVGNTKDYIITLENLVTEIRSRNNKIQIIFVNGELAREEDGNFIGSNDLYNILDTLKKSNLVEYDFVKLLDMNSLIDTLEKNNQIVFEMAFPYLYLRRIKNKNALVVARDCKHAIPEVRRSFLQLFFELIFSLKLPLIEIEKIHFDKIQRGFSYQKRALSYLTTLKYENALETNCPKEFSLIASYDLVIQDDLITKKIEEFIKIFCSKYPMKAIDLKDKFYFMRTISAFMYSNTSISLIDDLCEMGFRILSLEHKDLQPYMNFALLWLLDIATILLHFKTKCYYTSNEKMTSFFHTLSANNNFNIYSEIEMLIKNYKDLNER